MLILFIVEVGSSSAGVVKNITSSTCEKTGDIGGKSKVRPKLYRNVIFLHDFDEK